MIDQSSAGNAAQKSAGWLKRYYFVRFAVAATWVAVAFTIADGSAALAAVMLVAFPAWDALANLIDARRNGGLAVNKTQRLNCIVSGLTAIAVAAALSVSMNAVLSVFGVWAAVSGICQLVVALRRRKAYDAQWPMMLSGAQSALAGVFFLKMASELSSVSIARFAPYAALGAFYFLVSAIWLTVSTTRHHSTPVA